MEKTKQKYTDELIKILYNAQINNMDYPYKEMELFENKIGSNAFYEIFETLSNNDYTKIELVSISYLGGNGYKVMPANPFLTIEAVEYAEYLNKPAWYRFFIDLRDKEINWTKWGVIIAFLTWGIGLILTALTDFDKIEANYNKYFVHKIYASTELKNENPTKEVKNNE